MVILIGGIVAVIIGAVWAVIWWCPMLEFLAAVIPPVLILGGAIAIYFGVDEIRYPPPQVPPAYEPKEPTPPTPEPSKESATAGPAEGEKEQGPK